MHGSSETCKRKQNAEISILSSPFFFFPPFSIVLVVLVVYFYFQVEPYAVEHCLHTAQLKKDFCGKGYPIISV
jgi:hypothetical protein